MRKILFVLAGILACLSANAEDYNVTLSPDGTKEAFTRNNDLWVRNVSTGMETRLTMDGSSVILNGYASWVYYEEVFGRSSRYKAFWWSPDSGKIAYYRFDNTNVPMFPIYSPFGQDGHLSETRYPKAGERNPDVRIAIVDLGTGTTAWADFEAGEQYFGTPFWGPDSKEFFVQREPRRQDSLGIYSVDAASGKAKLIYKERYDTWVEFLDGVVFTDKGLYMARDFETGWQQIYFLSYDGKTFRRLTSGENWGINILKVDERKGDIWFMAMRDSKIHPSLCRVDRRGTVTTLTDPDYYARNVEFLPGGKEFTVELSTSAKPWRKVRCDAYKGYKAYESLERDDSFAMDLSSYPKPEIVKITNDGFDLYGLMTLPKNFNPSEKYPVMMEVYGGPGTAYVRDYWENRDATNKWCWENGIIYMVVDPRSSGENGRRGMDQAYRQMTVIELQDYIAWSKYMKSLPYVKGDRIGVEGFSFGGTTTSMLVLRYPEYFSCGIAGGGVYDWHLYDSIYTERFMDIPSENEDGYARASVLTYLKDYTATKCPSGLRLTHGTGDDNVHFQNTLQMIDALQNAGVQFELMIYPDGMHGYRGKQAAHDSEAAHDFWTRMLLR